MSEIELGGVDADEGVLSYCAEFDDSLFFPLDLEDNGRDDDGCFLWGELRLEVAVGVGEEDSFGWGD